MKSAERNLSADFLVVYLTGAATLALLGIGAADTFFAFLFCADKIPYNSCCDHSQDTDYNYIFHNMSPNSGGLFCRFQCVLCFHILACFQDQTNHDACHNGHGEQTCDGGNHIQRTAYDQRTHGINEIGHGVANGQL